METINNEQLTALKKAMGLGDVIEGTTRNPQTGIELSITDISVATFQPKKVVKVGNLTDDQIAALGLSAAVTAEDTVSVDDGAEKQWAKVTFSDGGVLSLRGVLQSPDMTAFWKNANTDDRINQLTDAKLMFLAKEAKTSKTGSPYNVIHIIPSPSAKPAKPAKKEA